MTGASALFVHPYQTTEVEDVISPEHADHVRLAPGRSVLRRKYFEPQAAGSGPEGFLVEMPSPCENAAHFHEVDQFQLFFGGNEAWYQRHDLAALTIHYTDAYSTYGPFGCRNDGTFRFFTLRAQPSAFAGFMPEDRHLLVRRGRRNYAVDVDLGATPSGGDSEAVALIGPESDGLAAHLVSLGPDSVSAGPQRGPFSVGRYYCVIVGSLELDGETFGVNSVGWTGPGETLPALKAGSSGCAVLVLQFPAT